MDPRPPRRELTAFDIGCVVIGGIVGVGIFFTPAKVAARTASPTEVMLTWMIGGLLAVLGALVFAELASRVPGHGGLFRYIHAAFGRLPSFLYGWANWLVIQAGALGIVALLCVDHLERALLGTAATPPGVQVGLAALAIALFTLTNLVGLRVGKRVQNALTVTKTLATRVLFATALWAPSVATTAAAGGAGAAPAAPPRADAAVVRLAGALLPVLFAIGGWQQGSFVAGAARDPVRSVPRGILAGVAVVVAVYLAINLAYLELLGFDAAAHSRAIGADAAAAAFGAGGERWFAAMVAISAAGIMNTICMAPPYVLYAMAQEGLFPGRFARLHPRFGTPVEAVLGQGLWATALLLATHAAAGWLLRDAPDRTLQTLAFLCDGVVFVDWLFFALCGFALLRLRRRGGAAPFAAPGGGAIAVAFTGGALLVTAGALAANAGPSLAGGALAASGLLAYRLTDRGRRPRPGGPPDC